MTHRLYRPELVAALVKAAPEQIQHLLIEAVNRMVANPAAPAGHIRDTIRGIKRGSNDRYVVDACIGWYITYEVLVIPPLVSEHFVRIITITALGEYQRPL